MLTHSQSEHVFNDPSWIKAISKMTSEATRTHSVKSPSHSHWVSSLMSIGPAEPRTSRRLRWSQRLRADSPPVICTLALQTLDPLLRQRWPFQPLARSSSAGVLAAAAAGRMAAAALHAAGLPPPPWESLRPPGLRDTCESADHTGEKS